MQGGVVADRLVVDLDTHGSVSVSLCMHGELAGAPTADARELMWPLNGDALEGLRWYLEDYLRAPYGVYGDRGAAVARALRGWGEAVFGAVFGSGPGHDAYLQARARTETSTELVVRSPSAALLGLPWELMCDPSRPTPLALELAGLTRRLPTPAGDLDEAVAAGGDRLRVLMVISRPRGPRDVGYRMIARPLLERLKLARGRVELVVLRPPTLEALSETLAGALAAAQPFQVVHFDGHGVLTGSEGALVFETSNGRPDRVPAGSLARVLRSGRVPLVVLNACQSGAVGKQLEAAVATRLLQEGIASVVAMAYRVHAVAAAEFMVAFYDRLFGGDTIAGAVGAGRRRLHERNERPSPKGMMPLADWVVPVHYQHQEVEFPELRAGVPRGRSPEVDDRSGEDPGLAPVGTFVGRDDLFYELERAGRLHQVVVLHGLGGTGKTELAKAFGRWWLDTGGVETADGVIVHSFEPGGASFGLDGVVSEIGLRVLGADFARLDTSDRQLLAGPRLGPAIGPTDQVWAVAIGEHDGRTVLVSGHNETVRVWDLAHGTLVRELAVGHEDRVGAVAVGAVDGRSVIVAGTDDGTLRLWQAETAQPQRVRVGSQITGLAIAEHQVVLAADAGLMALEFVLPTRDR
jgi:hypothetical protein